MPQHITMLGYDSMSYDGGRLRLFRGQDKKSVRHRIPKNIGHYWSLHLKTLKLSNVSRDRFSVIVMRQYLFFRNENSWSGEFSSCQKTGLKRLWQIVLVWVDIGPLIRCTLEKKSLIPSPWHKISRNFFKIDFENKPKGWDFFKLGYALGVF